MENHTSPTVKASITLAAIAHADRAGTRLTHRGATVSQHRRRVALATSFSACARNAIMFGQLPTSPVASQMLAACWSRRSEEHTSELQSLMRISYAVFCLKKKKTKQNNNKSSQRRTTIQHQTHGNKTNHKYMI